MRSTSLLSIMPRLLVEVVVIVVGVLLALWVDAFWEERMDREAERAALTAIHQEFVDNQRDFDRAIDHHKRILEALILILESNPSDCNEDLLAAIQLAAYHWQTFNPFSAATQSLIASGRLDLVQDDDLRIQLATWSGFNSDFAQDEMRTVERRDKIADYVAREFPQFGLQGFDGPYCKILVGDGTFRMLLTLRFIEVSEVILEKDRISESIQKILDATDPATL